MSNIKYDKVLTCRCTVEERKALKIEALRRGLSLARYMVLASMEFKRRKLKIEI